MKIELEKNEMLDFVESQIKEVVKNKENSDYSVRSKALKQALIKKWTSSEYKEIHNIDLIFDQVGDILFVETRYLDPYSEIFESESYRYCIGESLLPNLDKTSKFYKVNNSEYTYELYYKIISDVNDLIKLKKDLKTTKYELGVEVDIIHYNNSWYEDNRKVETVLLNDLVKYLNDPTIFKEYKYLNINFRMFLNSLNDNKYGKPFHIKNEGCNMINSDNISIVNDIYKDFIRYIKLLSIKECFKPINDNRVEIISEKLF